VQRLILTERRLVRTPVGAMALAAAAVDDVAALRAAVATLRREFAGRAAVGVAGNQSAAALRPLAFAEGWPH
jgi:Kef-type K+ transport system membrane component KefB